MKTRPRFSLWPLVACQLAFWMLSCEDPQDTTPATPVVQQPLLSEPQATDYSNLAKAIALTLRLPEMRQVVLHTTGESPYDPRDPMPLHDLLALHPKFAATMLAKLPADGDGDRLRAVVVQPHSEFVLAMPSAYDRATWRGTDEIVVVGGSWSWLIGVDSVAGYDIHGDSVYVHTKTTAPFPVIAITDGAAELARDRSVEYAAAGNGAPFKGLGFTAQECSNPDSAQDLDTDGFLDSCESAFAHAFAPIMRVNPEDDVSREEYWEFQRFCRPPIPLITFEVDCTAEMRDTVYALFYGFGYYTDWGDDKKGVGAHPGDSEFLVVWLEHGMNSIFNSPRLWRVRKVFFSAHWGEWWRFNSSDWVSGGTLQWVKDENGADRFRTWVAEFKHANYYEEGKCNKGAIYQDNCDNNTDSTDFEIIDTAKFALSTGWIRSRGGRPGYEQFWVRNFNFCGWHDFGHRRSICAGSYDRALSAFGFRPKNRPPGNPIPPVEIVAFSGPTLVQPGDTICTWTVFTHGGSPPIRFDWRGILNGSGYSDGEPYDISGSVRGPSGWLKVRADYTARDSIEVSVSREAPNCLGTLP